MFITFDYIPKTIPYFSIQMTFHSKGNTRAFDRVRTND